MIPFFVADRPASLRILRGLPFGTFGGTIGLMAPANATRNFRRLFRDFPCVPDEGYCDAVAGPCWYPSDQEACPVAHAVRSQVVKACDSAVFTKGGCDLEYERLFQRYEEMGADYGVMIDAIRDPQATIASAQLGLQAAKSFRPGFKLVGVAQGEGVQDYLECFRALADLGMKTIAVGGLLAKNDKTSRWVAVRDEGLLDSVLQAIRRRYKSRWLFALGCYHPKRHELLSKYGVWGSDFKGWIFNYRLWHQQAGRVAGRLADAPPGREGGRRGVAAAAARVADLARRAERARRHLVAARRRRGQVEAEPSTALPARREYERLLGRLRSLVRELASVVSGAGASGMPAAAGELLRLCEADAQELRFEQVRTYVWRDVLSRLEGGGRDASGARGGEARRLLIVGCSARKRRMGRQLPAIELYDGPMFRMLRRARRRRGGGGDADILILSAKHGLLTPESLVGWYDESMTDERAGEQAARNERLLSLVSSHHGYRAALVCLGARYLPALGDVHQALRPGAVVSVRRGRIGEQVSAARKWLTGGAAP